jgi:hypothetical protein
VNGEKYESFRIAGAFIYLLGAAVLTVLLAIEGII